MATQTLPVRLLGRLVTLHLRFSFTALLRMPSRRMLGIPVRRKQGRNAFQQTSQGTNTALGGMLMMDGIWVLPTGDVGALGTVGSCPPSAAGPQVPPSLPSCPTQWVSLTVLSQPQPASHLPSLPWLLVMI